MTHMMNSIADMDAMSVYLILGLSVIWSYFIYETTDSWINGVVSMPLFSGCSLVAVYLMQTNGFFIADDKNTDIIFGTCIGSIIGLVATFIAIRLMMNISGARLNSAQKKETARREAAQSRI